MTALGRPPEWRGGAATLAPVLARALRTGDLVVTMGAGDVTRVGPAVLAARGTSGS